MYSHTPFNANAILTLKLNLGQNLLRPDGNLLVPDRNHTPLQAPPTLLDEGFKGLPLQSPQVLLEQGAGDALVAHIQHTADVWGGKYQNSYK